MERFVNILEVLDLQIQRYLKLDGSSDANGSKVWFLLAEKSIKYNPFVNPKWLVSKINLILLYKIIERPKASACVEVTMSLGHWRSFNMGPWLSQGRPYHFLF